MWNTTKLEAEMERKLKEAFPTNDSMYQSIMADYVKARDYALEISSKIGTQEPDLTDHGPEHIADVMGKAFDLVKGSLSDLNFAEIYFLCTIILLHDLGNIKGRMDHQNKIGELYTSIRSGSKYNNERVLVLNAVAAHCGKSKDGNHDTLVYLSPTQNLLDERLRLRELAAVLRFADELAEGPQRTCDYLVSSGKIANASEIYHVYSLVTDIFVDVERIIVSYFLEVEKIEETSVAVEALLQFIHSRIVKLDEERRYCKYYTNLLSPFKQTQVSFNIYYKNQIIETITDVRLEDKFNLSSDSKVGLCQLLTQYPKLEVNSLLETIKKAKNCE